METFHDSIRWVTLLLYQTAGYIFKIKLYLQKKYNMKRSLLSLIVILFTIQANAQVLYLETFDGISGPTAGGAGTYTFPPAMLLRNVDNLTPNPAVSYVNAAWSRREDFNFNVADSCAFS
ncbi:MAG TPA: hypothetical protein PKC41_08435, partial [Chitinophagaceae bacterium]|nr:hypothetical protein [Chitinophagaceae bacterium]